MPQDPLLSEIAERCRTFSAGTGVSLNKIAKLIDVETGNFSAFVNGRIGLSAASTVKLLQLLNLTKRQVEEKLAIKPVTLAHFQQGGKQVAEQVRFAAPPVKQFDSWVPGLANGGSDPNCSTDITSTNNNPARSVPDAAELEFLAGLAGLHRQIIDRIDNWQAQQKAKPNKDGVTESPRKINSNADSSKPGPRASLFTDNTDQLRHRVELMRQEREKAEEQLRLQRELTEEKDRWFAAKSEVCKKA
jgi:hypothetical protein